MVNPSSPPGIMRTCPSCKSPVEPGHKFCEICGAKMPDLPVCRKCGAQFIAPVKFCELCGTPVISEEIPRVKAAEPPVPGPGPEPVPDPVPEPAPQPRIVKPQPVPAGVPPIDELTMTPETPVIPEKEKPPAPAKSPLNKVLILGGIVVLLIIIAGAYFVGLPMLRGGLPGGAAPAPVATPQPTLQPVPASPPAPAVQSPKVTVPPTPDNSLVPQATQQIPKNQEVFFDVQKDQVNAKITILFQRGPGENIIRSADVKVTHPDGSVVTGILKPSQGSELTLDGSKGTDRVEVIANMFTGQSYRVKDELVAYKGH
jgi:hypothetical protein